MLAFLCAAPCSLHGSLHAPALGPALAPALGPSGRATAPARAAVQCRARGETYEVALTRPVGILLEEREGQGVVVSRVYEGSAAEEGGIQAGDVVVATSASVGPQMWPKATLAGVESAIRTRIDGVVRLRLTRAPRPEDRERRWLEPIVQMIEVELQRPLGLVLRACDDAPGGGSDGDGEAEGKAIVEVAEVSAGGSAAASGRVRPGDLVVATSASVGEAMWSKSSLDGVVSAINTRLALAKTVRLRLRRRELLGPWAVELHRVGVGDKDRLTDEAIRSYRAYRRASRGQLLTREMGEAVRDLCHAFFARPRNGKRAAPTTRSLQRAAVLRKLTVRLRRCAIPLDNQLCNEIMSAAIRAGDPQLALQTFESLGKAGVPANARTFTTLIKAHDACGQRAEALAVLQRMRAEQVAPTQVTYNVLMAVCERHGDRTGMLSYFGMMRGELAPTAESYNIILAHCARARQAGQAEEVLARMRREGLAPTIASYGALVNAHVLAGDMERAESLLAAMDADGVAPDVSLLNTLLGGYAAKARTSDAFSALNLFAARGVDADLMSYSLLLRACLRAKAPPLAEAAMRRLREAGLQPNVQVSSMLLSTYAQAGWLDSCLATLRAMQAEGLTPNKYTYSAMMEGCVVAGEPPAAIAIFDEMVEQGISADVVSYTLLIRALVSPAAPRGSLRRAFILLRDLSSEGSPCLPNANTYNAMLSGCMLSSAHEHVLTTLRLMLERGVSPTRGTFGQLALLPRSVEEPIAKGGPAAQEAAAAHLRFLVSAIRIFEQHKRQVGGEVYLSALRLCHAARDGEVASELLSLRAARRFRLRKEHEPEAAELERGVAARVPQVAENV